MLLSNVDIADRVAHRYRYRQARTREDPHDHPRVWTIPPTFPEIPDDFIIQHSDGCVVTTEDVESSIRQTMNIVRGSCRFFEVHARNESNGARFEVLAEGGRKLRGLVTVNIVADARMLTAFSIIELDVDSSV